MTPVLDLNAVVQQNESKFLSNALGDEVVMMNMDSGDYLGINNVGADIWNLLAEPITVADLMKKIMDIYDVDEKRCEAEVESFLNKMQQHDMLIVK